jgi:hypothetical protein
LSTAVFAQPVAGLQESVVHTLLSLQFGATPAVQTPPWQVSAPLHALLSLQAVPLLTLVCTQPVVGLQESVVQTLESLQLGGVPVVQTAPRHTSAPLQAFPSEHEKPSACGGLAHEPALQTSAVHGLPSLQLAGVVQD